MGDFAQITPEIIDRIMVRLTAGQTAREIAAQEHLSTSVVRRLFLQHRDKKKDRKGETEHGISGRR